MTMIGNFNGPGPYVVDIPSPVSGAWKRSRALVRFQGICKNGTPFNITPASTLAFTHTVKHEAPAPFLGVQFLADNGAPNAQTVNQLAFGVTETAAFTATGLTASQNMSAPVIGGVAYNTTLVTSGNLGYRQVTFGASATYGLPAGNAARQYALSDVLSIASVPRADGGTRPLYLMRQKPDPAGYNFLTAQAAMRTPTAANRGRIMQASSFGGDGIAVPSSAFTIGTTYTDTYPIFSFLTPVLSVWAVGDSIMQGNSVSIIADGYSNYSSRACADLQDATGIPVAYANLGCNSQNAAYYWAQAKALLALGVPAPSVLVIGPASTNDGSSAPTQATVDAQIALAFDVLAVAKQYGIPHVVWVPWLVNENLTNVSTTFYDDKRKLANGTLKSLAAAQGVSWVDFATPMGDGASPERWLAPFKFDEFHPSEFAHESPMSSLLLATLRKIVGA
ncbi:SGNH/GDSL hydrolase family protein [Roseateles sp. PN1]|uniref:SGNH/GDSL hydrolase family protein n=1 Tax=Roseateles sp. PN1 TaxID=3137372 RepID=UPI003138C5F3